MEWEELGPAPDLERGRRMEVITMNNDDDDDNDDNDDVLDRGEEEDAWKQDVQQGRVQLRHPVLQVRKIVIMKGLDRYDSWIDMYLNTWFGRLINLHLLFRKAAEYLDDKQIEDDMEAPIDRFLLPKDLQYMLEVSCH